MRAGRSMIAVRAGFTALLTAALLLTRTGAGAQLASGPALLVVLRSEPAGPVLGIVDPVAGKIVSRVPIGIDPHGVAVSEDGKMAYVANTNAHGKTVPDGDSISVVDIAARKEIRRVEIGQGSRPHEIRVLGGKAYFSASGFKAVGRYDLTRHKIDYFGLGQNGPHMFAVSKDGKRIFAANNGSGTVSVVDGEGPPDWTTTIVPVGKTPEGTDLSPDGTEVWTVNEESGSVSIIDAVKKTAKETVDLGTDHANRLRFTPDGKRVVVLDREIGEVVVVDAASRKTVKNIKLPGDTSGQGVSLGDLVVLPDASRVYVAADGRASGAAHYIAEIDLKTLEVTRRIEMPTTPDGLAWAAPR